MKIETTVHDNVTLLDASPVTSNRIQKPSPKLKDLSPTEHFSFTKNDPQKTPNGQENVQISGMLQNAITKVQTADAALQKIQHALQFGKELTIQASHKTTSMAQRQELQDRLQRINQQIDKTNETISHSVKGFHLGKGVTPDDVNIIHSLKSDWFEASENLVERRYGLKGDGSTLKIVLDESAPKYLAAVGYMTDNTGKTATQILHINTKAVVPATLPNGGYAPQYDDRVIAHEMVHAIMGRNMNYASLPTWFKEGTAEFLPGADERIATSVRNNGGGMAGAMVLQKKFGDGTNRVWKDDSDHYSAATMAVRYLHENIKTNGHSGGIKDLLADLTAHPEENLDDALSHVSSYKNVAEFAKAYNNKQKTGAEYIFGLYQKRAFSNTDVGSIGGQDVDGGPALTAETVVPDFIRYSETPLKHFKIEWPEQFQVSTAAPFDSGTLGTQSIDVVNNPKDSLNRFDKALSKVTAERTRLDKVINQLDRSLRQQVAGTGTPINNQHFLRVRDQLTSPDFLISQANTSPEKVTRLL